MPDDTLKRVDANDHLTDTVVLSEVLDVSDCSTDSVVLEAETVFQRAAVINEMDITDEIETAVSDYDGEYDELCRRSRDEALKLLVQAVMARRHAQVSK